MAVSLIVGMVRALAAVFPEPGRLLAEINDRLADRLHGAFATTIALRLDAQGNCAVASAGHLPPFINARELDLAGALPLGIAPGVFYAESKFHIEESDRLALYTDGLLEARNPSGDIYGFDRLRALFASNPTAEAAAQAAVQFGQDDDITVLSLTRLAVAKASAASHQGPALVPA
jgi:serine phosphatase RsbU (regulator of sigma subunit)